MDISCRFSCSDALGRILYDSVKSDPFRCLFSLNVSSSSSTCVRSSCPDRSRADTEPFRLAMVGAWHDLPEFMVLKYSFTRPSGRPHDGGALSAQSGWQRNRQWRHFRPSPRSVFSQYAHTVWVKKRWFLNTWWIEWCIRRRFRSSPCWESKKTYSNR